MNDGTPFGFAKDRATGIARQNIELIERFFGALGHDIAELCSLFSQDALYRMNPESTTGTQSGPMALRQSW